MTHSCEAQKPFPRRGVLSTINSVFDPLGFLSPVTVQGRMLLRELLSQGPDWNTPLPLEKLVEWQRWQATLQELNWLNVSRCYTSFSLSKATSSLEELWEWSCVSFQMHQSKQLQLCHTSNQPVRMISQNCWDLQLNILAIKINQWLS